jgi:hypothetical protein
LPDLKKRNHLKAEVNWNPDDPDTNLSQVIKFVCPNGEEVMVKREHLNEILFALGSPEEQRSMIPQTIQTVHHLQTVLGIRATKDIAKGEMINIPVDMPFACTNTAKIIGRAAYQKEVHNAAKKSKWSGLIK